MAIRLEDQFLKTKRIKSNGPTVQEMIDMQHQHEQAMKELDRQIPFASGKTRKFVFTK
jgi:hypothetical protein